MTTTPPTGHADRCPRCLCEDCGGRLDQHTDTGCACESCEPSPYLGPGCPCSLAEFIPEQRLSLLAEALAPWLSPHLNEAAKLRWLAVAHAAHHALHDYDHPEDADHA